MLNPFKAYAARLDAKVAASDSLMRANGHLVQHDGRWSRTYRPDHELITARQHEAAQLERDQIWLDTLAETDRKAALADAYRRTHPLPAGPAPASVPAVTLDQVVAALAGRFTDLDRITFERMVIERAQTMPLASGETVVYDPQAGAWR